MPDKFTRQEPFDPGQYNCLNTETESHRCLTFPQEQYETWGTVLENLAANGFYLSKTGENFSLSCRFCFNIEPLVMSVGQMFDFAEGRNRNQISEWHLQRAAYCKSTEAGEKNIVRIQNNVFESERACSLLAATFNNPGLWKVSPYDLARDGFYLYDPDANDDRVKCTSCEVVVGNWQHSDNVHEEHVIAAAGNECDFIDGTPIGPRNIPVRKENYYRRHGVIEYDGPAPFGFAPAAMCMRMPVTPELDAAFPKFSSVDDREMSFSKGWPLQESVPASQMAACGFFYAGQEDTTICYFCGLALHNWAPSDNPKEEHALYNPGCTMLLEMK